MNKKIIAAQLYTLRDFCKTPEDLAKTLKKVKKMGFEAVQVSGVGPIDNKELAKIIKGEGLVCCATHEPGKVIIEETEKVIEKLNILDCEYTAYPYPHSSPKTKKDYIKLAKDLDKAGKKMKKAGITLTYHNHAIEFEKFDGKTALDIIYDTASPEYLQGEIDTYWVQYGGGNPVEWCEKLKKRLPLLHLKEFGIVQNQITMMEVGYGNLAWKKIVAAAKKSGTKWFIIEEDTCRFDPFKSLKMSFDYMVEEL